MNRLTGYMILFLIMVIAMMQGSYAQSGFYVPKSAKIFFIGDSATIFNNVINYGQLGVGKNATLNFKGLTWENDIDALITDESNFGNGVTGQGGLIRFLIPDEFLPLTVAQQQRVIGGYNPVSRMGAMFANVQISNRWGVRMDMGSMKIRNQLDFRSGHIYTDDYTLVVGHHNPGKITGYNEQRFVVTGNRNSTGNLLREGLSRKDGAVSFPVGSTVTGYAPATIYLRSDNPDDFYARVSDTVWSNAVSGGNINSKSVNKTWQIGKILRPGVDDVEVNMQHQLGEEGIDFSKHRLFSYVSQYRNSAWDTALFKIAPTSPGSITTGTPVSNAATNSRTFFGGVSAQSYYTKFSYPFADSIRNNLWASGFRLNAAFCKIIWTTRPEVNIRYFVVQRRLANQSGWTNIDSVLSQAINGYSFSYLNYSINDPNNFNGMSFYRIVMVDYQGGRAYSEIIEIDGQSQPKRFALWPNPSTGRFMISIDKLQRIKTLVIWNALGQKYREVDVQDKELVEMFIFTPGTYVVGFISAGKIVETKRVVITGW
ncbi:MAG: T9SS type A sorting domain-containing protein [Chitinophagaceae bacterium]|nr:MAG: T9SS type A sorting domain-containing protein [Chitinophagaceae bacterium]